MRRKTEGKMYELALESGEGGLRGGGLWDGLVIYILSTLKHRVRVGHHFFTENFLCLSVSSRLVRGSSSALSDPRSIQTDLEIPPQKKINPIGTPCHTLPPLLSRPGLPHSDRPYRPFDNRPGRCQQLTPTNDINALSCVIPAFFTFSVRVSSTGPLVTHPDKKMSRDATFYNAKKGVTHHSPA
jgi:hypothetical protein